MSNIFENAKFGEIFVAKDGTSNLFCSFTKTDSETLARLYRKDWGVVIFYLDGQVHSGGDIDFTITERESINEENIKRLCVGARALCGVLDENGIDCPEKEFVSNMADNLMSELIK